MDRTEGQGRPPDHSEPTQQVDQGANQYDELDPEGDEVELTRQITSFDSASWLNITTIATFSM
ncbi:hypothetical protein DMH04_55605 [Kibdelosporangium aridum]|uniref:Uncharacterized protein n=1 Tax=Kibdelosporangium aridum TaxID=2030 RepID=A0A428XW99_KIBAR|nr:hypothetical protein [Kibdelosporangium aridum]RSM59621.1 hypothetical protein DMH04_55605 [Kibdelosporangium aridum]